MMYLNLERMRAGITFSWTQIASRPSLGSDVSSPFRMRANVSMESTPFYKFG